MISSAIWVLISIGKFSKTTKLHKSSGQVQFVVFEVFRNAYYTKLHEKSCCYLLIMYIKKHDKVKTDINFDSMYHL